MNGKMRSAEQCRNEAKAYEGACCSSRTNNQGGGKIDEFDWTEHLDYPIDRFGERDGWLKWYAEEREGWFFDYGDNQRFDHLEQYWKGNPDDPIIAVVEPDGRHFLWDGNHRVAISHLFGRNTIHVILGKRRQRTPKSAA